MAPIKGGDRLKELKQSNALKPHASKGGAGYGQDMRKLCVEYPHAAPPYIPGITPNRRTRRRWRRMFAMTGSWTGYERRGNKRPTSMVGRDLWLLLLFRKAFPRATAAEVAAIIYNNTLNLNPKIYTPSQITAAEDRLGLTRKRSSTAALQAFTDENRMNRWMFRHLPFPFGRVNIPIMSLIDVDECGIMLEQTNRHYGKSYFGFRVVEKGKYGRGVKWTITLAVAATGERWCRVQEKAGTTSPDYVNFIQHILGTIDGNAYDGIRTLLMDNLNAHHCPLVHQSIDEAGQQVLYRPKYSPADAPIEYVFTQNSYERYHRGESPRTHHCNYHQHAELSSLLRSLWLWTL